MHDIPISLNFHTVFPALSRNGCCQKEAITPIRDSDYEGIGQRFAHGKDDWCVRQVGVGSGVFVGAIELADEPIEHSE